MEWSLQYGSFGAITAVFVLVGMMFVPFSPLSFGVVDLSDGNGGSVGTRLYIAGYHIHHYVFGIILMSISGITYYYTKHDKIAIFFLAFGAVLFIDQLPNLLGLTPWGASMVQGVIS